MAGAETPWPCLTGCARYRGGISSPWSAPGACFRLSPHLAELEPGATRQRQGLTAFLGRLHRHCHFIQKLESAPQLEYRNLHHGYDGLREDE